MGILIVNDGRASVNEMQSPSKGEQKSPPGGEGQESGCDRGLATKTPIPITRIPRASV